MFNCGITDLCNTLDTNAQECLTFECDQNIKTFMDKHGDALCNRVHLYCNVSHEVDLPAVHSLLTKAPKN